MFDKRAQFRFRSAGGCLRLLAPRHVDSNARNIRDAFEFHPYTREVVWDSAPLFRQIFNFHLARAASENFLLGLPYSALVLIGHISQGTNCSQGTNFRRRVSGNRFCILVPAQVLPGSVLQDKDARQAFDYGIRQSFFMQEGLLDAPPFFPAEYEGQNQDGFKEAERNCHNNVGAVALPTRWLPEKFHC